MKLRVQIVEDDIITAHDLKEILQAHDFEVVGISKTYEEALELFYDQKPEIVLADIGLKSERDGIELVNKINHSPDTCPVVYLSGNTDTKTKSRAFDTNPAAFLTKPFNTSTVIASLELAMDRFNKQLHSKSNSDRYLFVKKGDKFFKFNIDDIIYLHAEGSYCKVFSSEGEYLISGNLKSYGQKLSPVFIRVHRSFLINKTKITSIDANQIFLGPVPVAIGRKYKSEVKRITES